MTQREKKSLTGADVIVETLEARGVTHVFGVPGAKIDKVFDRLLDSSIQTVQCRHEQNAAFIAGGIGRLTGKAGVAIATSGPGVSNLVTGLVTANSEGDPMVALGGAVAVADRLKSIHQTLNSVEVCKPVTKYSAEIDSPGATSEVLSAAFRAAESGRPGAAFVSLPMDIVTGEAKCAPITLSTFVGDGPAPERSLREAARLINSAESPVILLGLMASKPQCGDAIRKLLSMTTLPVVGTFQAAGAISRELFPCFGGRVGQIANQPADTLLESGDVIITIGYDAVEYWPSLWNGGRDRAIVHVDVMPANIENDYVPAVELIGSIEETLSALSSLLHRSQLAQSSARLLRLIAEDRQRLMKEAATKSGVPIHPMRLISELQNMLTPDVTVCSDMGTCSMYLSRYLFSFRARQILISNGQQTLGVALPWAIAASIVRPHEKVLSISGDGGFLFSANELETAVRLKSHLVHMVWIDGSYDMVGAQEKLKYGRTSGVKLGPVDTVKYAEAFGATGLFIQRPEDIAPALRNAFETPGPVLIGVRVDYSDSVKLFERVHESAII
ncbi:acetolactate synthase AlsS [Granulicella mallensis]|uniref:Acetolactate synthase-1/2/3 large subunit n=1 Tax=Granulicella mallensis TaxID=940614 RepID=A0A7W7ZM91_9BACT|nr:acetolactate synthase AlsS [Granulicella mallensis]MBB5062498.1 acetolactate synthase-1/2/3 large subunit [Granulicella mallensis]